MLKENSKRNTFLMIFNVLLFFFSFIIEKNLQHLPVRIEKKMFENQINFFFHGKLYDDS
jgi:hypothetical protein